MADVLEELHGRLTGWKRRWKDQGVDSEAAPSVGLTAADIAAIGAASMGAQTDAPVEGDTPEDATARSPISLLKRIVNQIIALKTGIVLAAGTALIGKVGIDQTTEGITNGVVVKSFPASADITITQAYTYAFGEIAGAVTETQMPNIACDKVKFRAVASNVGNVYLGVDDCTKPDGTTDTTTGWELLPGDESPSSNEEARHR